MPHYLGNIAKCFFLLFLLFNVSLNSVFQVVYFKYSGLGKQQNAPNHHLHILSLPIHTACCYFYCAAASLFFEETEPQTLVSVMKDISHSLWVSILKTGIRWQSTGWMGSPSYPSCYQDASSQAYNPEREIKGFFQKKLTQEKRSSEADVCCLQENGCQEYLDGERLYQWTEKPTSWQSHLTLRVSLILHS